MVDGTNIVDIARELSAVRTAIRQATELTEDHAKDGSVNLQVVDSGLVSGYVLEGRTDQRTIKTLDSDLSLLGQETFDLYSRFAAVSPFKIVLSLPTVFEFANSLMRVSGRINKARDGFLSQVELYDRAMRLIEEELAAGDLKDNVDLARLIKDVVGLVPWESTQNNAQTLVDLVHDKSIVGLGEYFTRADYVKVRDTILTNKNRLFESLNRSRHRKDGETLDAFRFRNLIDACNFSISSALNRLRSDIQLSVAAPAPKLHDGRAVQRLLDERTLPSALCLALKARELAQDLPNQNVEILSWLEAFGDRVSNCLKYLGRVQRPSDLTDNRKREIFMLYEVYIKPSFGKGRANILDAETAKRARELFSSRSAFRDRLQEAGAAIENAAVSAFEVKPVLTSEEVIMDLGLNDSPQIQRIAQRFGPKIGLKT